VRVAIACGRNCAQPCHRPADIGSGKHNFRPDCLSWRTAAGLGNDPGPVRKCQPKFPVRCRRKNRVKSSATGNQVPSQSKSSTCLRDVLPILIGKCARCHGDETSVLQIICRQGRIHSGQIFQLEGNKPPAKLLPWLGNQPERVLRRTNSNVAQMTRRIRWPQQMSLGCGTMSGGRLIFKRHGCGLRKCSNAFDQELALIMTGAKQQRTLVSSWVVRFWVQPIYHA